MYKLDLFYAFCDQALSVDKELHRWLDDVNKQGYAVLNQVITVIYNILVTIVYYLVNVSKLYFLKKYSPRITVYVLMFHSSIVYVYHSNDNNPSDLNNLHVTRL